MKPLPEQEYTKSAPSKKGLNIYIVGAKSIRKGMGVEYIAEIPRVYQT